METLTIKIKDGNALKLIQDLETLNLIQVVVNSEQKKPAVKLSALLSGSISAEQANDMQKEVTLMRDEWQRDIY